MTRAVGCLRAFREHFVASLVCRSAEADWQRRLGDALHRTGEASPARQLELPGSLHEYPFLAMALQGLVDGDASGRRILESLTVPDMPAGGVSARIVVSEAAQ